MIMMRWSSGRSSGSVSSISRKKQKVVAMLVVVKEWR